MIPVTHLYWKTTTNTTIAKIPNTDPFRHRKKLLHCLKCSYKGRWLNMSFWSYMHANKKYCKTFSVKLCYILCITSAISILAACSICWLFSVQWPDSCVREHLCDILLWPSSPPGQQHLATVLQLGWVCTASYYVTIHKSV